MFKRVALIMFSLLLLAACTPSGFSSSGTAFATPSPEPTAAATVTSTPMALSAILSEVQGEVEARQPEQVSFTAAENGLTLQEQGQVHTLEDGQARVDLSTGTLIRMAPSSLFTVASNEPVQGSLLTRIKLEAGKLWVILRSGVVEVETPSGQASVRGSYMMVEIAPETLNVLVTCLEGTCEVVNPAGRVILGTGELAQLLHPDQTGGKYITPIRDRMSELDILEWVEFNPEAGEILPLVRATLAARPTREPVLQRTPTPGQILTQLPNPTLPGILPTLPGILPTLPGILPDATRTPLFNR